jgi:hypothetical protein
MHSGSKPKLASAASLLLALVTLLGLNRAFGQNESLLEPFQWRNLGPGNFSGRIVDVEALENDFRHVLVASASGGVWKSVNAGVTWKPIFDSYRSSSIGDIALFQKDPAIIWVGTGEANNRNSVSWGDGIYKSTDGGETFVHMGLQDSFQIARVVTHPTDPKTVYVAAIGNLWGHTGERGLFKTIDGGESWTKLTDGLPNDGRTGATDLILSPSDPNTLFVAFYERLRRPHRFDSGGPNGGIFKSSDGGRTWDKLTQGLPQGPTGRIGLAVCRGDSNILMAILEHAFQPNTDDPDFEDLSKPGSGIYRSEDGGATWKFVNRFNNRPFYYSQIRINPTDPDRVYVLTRRFHFSYDGGRTLQEGGDGFVAAYDYHAMWIDPQYPERFYVGADKGLWLTHDHGEAMMFYGNLPVGQFYAIGVDQREPYYVYGGTQDNGTWGGPSFSRDARGVLNGDVWKLHWGDGMFVQVDPTDWRKVFTEAENGSLRLYDASNFRVTPRHPTPQNISNYGDFVKDIEDPTATRLPRSHFRFNWRSPMLMSPHSASVLYLGGNHLFMTADEGVTWRIISPDLSTNDPTKTARESGGLTSDNSGAETHCTITALSESPLVPGLIWVGTDDGKVQLTTNFGRTWTDLTARLPGPKGTWVSSAEASHHKPGRAYLTFDGHRNDDRTTLVVRTSDYGATWETITKGLPPDSPAQVIREDSKNPSLLFLGTEFSLHVSLDGGNSWSQFMNKLPTVAIHDLVIHPRDNDLIAGTHGRGLWIMDDITPLQKLNRSVLDSNAHLFAPRSKVLWEDQSRGGQMGHFYLGGENPPSVRPSSPVPARAKVSNSAFLHFYLKEDSGEPVQLEITDLSGTRVHVVTLPPEAGLQKYQWDLGFDGDDESAPPAGPGSYVVKLRVGSTLSRQVLVLRRDPILGTRF